MIGEDRVLRPFLHYVHILEFFIVLFLKIVFCVGVFLKSCCVCWGGGGGELRGNLVD